MGMLKLYWIRVVTLKVGERERGGAVGGDWELGTPLPDLLQIGQGPRTLRSHTGSKLDLQSVFTALVQGTGTL